MPKHFGRIHFPGNPWPDGHAVTTCTWTARVERGTGIWFDLDLETEDYNANDPPGDGSDEDEDATDWKSKIVWNNYGSCILSSTRWPGNGCGFLAATKVKPLDLRAISGKTFRVDDPPVDFTLPRPFTIYLTGYDAVSAHRITFTRQRGKPTWAVKWLGRIALYYAGSEEFKYRFHTELTGVRFGGIVEFPTGADVPTAQGLLEPFVTCLPEWKVEERDGLVRAVPR